MIWGLGFEKKMMNSDFREKVMFNTHRVKTHCHFFYTTHILKVDLRDSNLTESSTFMKISANYFSVATYSKLISFRSTKSRM